MLTALKFCPKCKSLMSPQEKRDKFFLKCPKCGFFKEVKDKTFLRAGEKIKKEERRGKGIVGDKNIFATYPYKCKKCGYDKVQVIDAGVFYSDENNLILLKCGKCGYSERIGGKVT